MARGEDRLDLAVTLAQPLKELDPVHPGQSPVGHDDAGKILVETAER